MVDEKKLKIISEKPGFVAALDQSLNSTPAALRAYGIPDETYHSKEEMLNLIHDMRGRIIESSDFCSDHIIASILFIDTIKRKIGGLFVSEYLWQKKEILSFLKIDEGLAPITSGVQLMKPIEDFEEKLKEAALHDVFGTKMRSLVLNANPTGIKDLVDQQFELAKQVLAHDLIPIIETEVDIHSPEKEKAEVLLKKELLASLDALPKDQKVVIELTLPVIADFYKELVEHPNVIRVLAASAGYNKAEADKKLSQNHGVIASFSRALEEGLAYQETDFEFEWTLKESIEAIFKASIE